MSKLTTEEYLMNVQRSRLVPREHLLSVLKEYSETFQIRNRKKVPLEHLAQFLIEKRLLTQWQHARLLKGQTSGFYLGKYRLLRHLGSGGMSSVYLAEHQHMRRLVAIKVLPVSAKDDPSLLKRFQQEAKAIASLNHKNIVHAYSFDDDGTTYYMVMEYVEGSDLQKLVEKNGPLDPITAAYYIRQAAEGLAHAHGKGLIHRDVKPGNLLVDAAGTVKLMDLGLVQIVQDDTGLTREQKGAIIGTADYLAPEQAVDSHSIDHRADLYALGATFYFLLTGSPPFPTGTIAQRLVKHQIEEPKPISEFRSDVPPALVEIVSTLMAKKPVDRYQAAEAVVEALDIWLDLQDEQEVSANTEKAALLGLPSLDSGAWERSEVRSPFAADSSTGEVVVRDVFDSESVSVLDVNDLSGVHRAASRKSSRRFLMIAVALLLGVAVAAGAGFALTNSQAAEQEIVAEAYLGVNLRDAPAQEVSVWINGEQFPLPSKGPVEFGLPQGKHEVAVFRTGCKPYRLTVTIPEGQRREIVPPWHWTEERVRKRQLELLSLQIEQTLSAEPSDPAEIRRLNETLIAFQDRWPQTPESRSAEKLQKKLQRLGE